MALSARPVGVPSGPNVSSGHMPTGGRNIASVGFGPVDEINSRTGILADPNFSFQGFTEWMQQRRPEPPQQPSNPSSNFDTNSTTFLHLLVQQQRDDDPNALGAGKDGAGAQARLNKAIRAYESTADVIGGTLHKLGTSVSFSL